MVTIFVCFKTGVSYMRPDSAIFFAPQDVDFSISARKEIVVLPKPFLWSQYSLISIRNRPDLDHRYPSSLLSKPY